MSRPLTTPLMDSNEKNMFEKGGNFYANWRAKQSSRKRKSLKSKRVTPAAYKCQKLARCGQTRPAAKTPLINANGCTRRAVQLHCNAPPLLLCANHAVFERTEAARHFVFQARLSTPLAVLQTSG
jgi:hypothetical protein